MWAENNAPAIMRRMSSLNAHDIFAPQNIIAFETSSETLSVSVCRGDKTLSEDIANAGSRNSELALPTLHALMKSLDMAMPDVDLIAFGQGPGSFTGVRIACGIAQGLAFGLDRPIVQVPTTLILAEQARAAGHANIAVAIDARMGEIYFAAYQAALNEANGFIELVPPTLSKPDHIHALMGESAREYSLIGNALLDDTLATALRAVPNLAPITGSHSPQSFFLGSLAKRLVAARGRAATVEAQDAAPLYLRNNVAMTIDERATFHAAKTAGKLAAKVAA
jgi:tRNA threonylcarbamoyladenosine biosynthesis protein TsaB